MREKPLTPHAVGQLVWCPADTTLGIGKVTGRDGHQIRVRFAALTEDRAYTTRSELAVARYGIASGEEVTDLQGIKVKVRRPLGDGSEAIVFYMLEDGREVPESELTPRLRDAGAKERMAGLDLAHPETLRARLAGLALSQWGRRPGWAAVMGARAAWLPHQIDVACQALERERVRLVLADEVGLGKTVEAALIYAGLRQEGRAARVLVLTPEALCIQWLQEIYRKTHELMVLMDDGRIDDARRDHPGGNPFEAHQRMVMALPSLAADAGLADAAAAADFDLIVVDEAHHLRWRPEDGGNPAYRLVERLAGRCRHLLLLTATPMALDPVEYHALLRLVDPARFDDPAAFADVAARAAELREVALRVRVVVEAGEPVPPPLAARGAALFADDPADQKVWAALSASAPDDRGRRKQLASSLEALRARHALSEVIVRNRRGPVGGMPARIAKVVPLQPTAAQEVLLEVGETVMFELAESLGEPARVRRATGELLRALWAAPRALADILKPYSPELVSTLAPHIDAITQAPDDAQGLPTGDARLRWLVEHLRGLERGEKLLVFVESNVAVAALRDALEPYLGGLQAVFHAELSPRDQDRQVAWFRDPEGPAVMLSTEAGGEGRNFQFCHQVVLYDLPWRPATVEQRIGRIDRVGQRHDVQVWVPYFAHGYEAAVLKIMQQSIGVLDTTVGGIDHALEYVSDSLADLICEAAPTADWRELYTSTEARVGEARRRIDAQSDPLLDHASFSPERADKILAAVPRQLEARVESFVQRYAAHTKLQLQVRGKHGVAVTGAPSASGRADAADGLMATFHREHALDHEDLEFLSFGHPLVEQALEWARQSRDMSCALALCRGFPQEGAAFLWTYSLEVPEGARDLMAYLDVGLTTFALDEKGARLPALDRLLEDPSRSLERMDAAPLRAQGERWRRLIDGNHAHADALADAHAAAAAAQARSRLRAAQTAEARHLARAERRRVAAGQSGAVSASASAAASVPAPRLAPLMRALDNVRPRLLSVVALRMMRAKTVSI